MEVHQKKIVHKERKCLASLNKSITCLESCLESDKQKSSDPKKKKELPNSIVNRRKASLPRDGTIPRPIWPGDMDDSLTNINLEAFNLQSPSDLIQLNTPKSEKRQSTFTNTDSGKGTSEGCSEYMDMDYHETRNILVNIRSKLETLLEQHRNTVSNTNPFNAHEKTDEGGLEENIISLRNDLEKYLTVMTEKSELELQRFSNTMSKDSRIQTVTKAFDRSRQESFNSATKKPVTAYSCLSSHIKPPLSRKPSIEKGDFIMTCNDQINPFTATPCDTVIQIISSDASGGGESSDSLNCDGNKPTGKKCNRHSLSQMQKNLAFSQLINDSFNCSNAKYGDDRERMLSEWHRDKPSIWEMYYGTNRYSSKIEQAMIREYKYGNNCAMNVSYVSINNNFLF